MTRHTLIGQHAVWPVLLTGRSPEPDERSVSGELSAGVHFSELRLPRYRETVLTP